MLAYLVLLPLLTSLLFLFFPLKWAKEISFFVSLLTLALSLVLISSFSKDGGDQFIIQNTWIPSLGITFSLAADGISVLLVLLTTVLVPFILLSSFSKDRPSLFYGLILMMQAALIGVFVARDGFLFYVFWEMALIPIWFICLLWGEGSRTAITLKFFIYTLTGSLLMLTGLLYIYWQTPGAHSFDMQALYTAGRSLSAYEQGILFWALFAAFAIKMPIFPFHTWQPDTYSMAPTQGTMLLSAIMLKMGIYGAIRWLVPMVPQGVLDWGQTAMILSVIGIIYASCLALVQQDLKRLIAYSSFAHVGLIAAGVFTLNESGLQGALVQMLSHGLLVFALFYIVDIIDDRSKTRLLSQLGGIRLSAPVLTSVFIVVMLGSVALPFTSGFIGEFLLISALVKYQFVIGSIAGITIILGATYMLRAFQLSMLGEANNRTEVFADLTVRERVILYTIVVLVVAMGVHPGPLLDISEVASRDLLSIFSTLTASNH